MRRVFRPAAPATARAGRARLAPAFRGSPGSMPPYLHAQLVAFGNGTRDNAVMSPIARTLDVATMAKAAAYYASLEAPPPPPPVRPTPQIAAGETLASRGDWKDAIPACASCHGARGLGVGAAFPPIAGQSATYVINQLNAWKSGARHDDPLGLMWAVAGRLTVSQIAAVAAYCETLPAASAPKPTGNGSTP